jgi:hypothetical protein
MDERGWERLHGALKLGDPFDEVSDAWSAKEKVRAVYLTDDPVEAAARLEEAIDWCAASTVPEVSGSKRRFVVGAPRSSPITAPEHRTVLSSRSI